MVDETTFFEKLGMLQDELDSLHSNESEEVIDETALRLEGFNYTPPVYMALPRFLRCTKKELMQELERIAHLPDDEVVIEESAEAENGWELKLRHISVLVFYFKELASLRNGDLEAWDEIDELYVHD